eukprot:TRINITY_DN5717_c1_g1_i3.p3 TRINITY_DN5717_c1_g1~~TRINITY_DN5717_c1_g1_i3.p3  ORF type:complete len:145 (+),score=8.46 TRINITY_DN5717_c1_g1_i3:676-1110(+)
MKIVIFFLYNNINIQIFYTIIKQNKIISALSQLKKNFSTRLQFDPPTRVNQKKYYTINNDIQQEPDFKEFPKKYRISFSKQPILPQIFELPFFFVVFSNLNVKQNTFWWIKNSTDKVKYLCQQAQRQKYRLYTATLIIYFILFF